MELERSEAGARHGVRRGASAVYTGGWPALGREEPNKKQVQTRASTRPAELMRLQPLFPTTCHGGVALGSLPAREKEF